MEVDRLDQLTVFGFQPLADISVDDSILGLTKRPPFTVQVFILKVVSPIPLVDTIWIHEWIHHDSHLLTKLACQFIGFH